MAWAFRPRTPEEVEARAAQVGEFEYRRRTPEQIEARAAQVGEFGDGVIAISAVDTVDNDITDDIETDDDAQTTEQDNLKAKLLALKPEEAAELDAIAAAMQEDRRAFKKNKEWSAHYYLREAKRLNRVKEILGHGQFLPWVDEYCPYSRETGRGYQRALQAVEAGYIKIQTLCNLGLSASLKEADEAEGKQRFGSGGKSPGRKYGKKRQSQREWPRPQKDGQVLFVNWEMEPGTKQMAFVWLEDDAHPTAAARASRHGPGPAALEYQYFIVHFQTDPGGVVSHEARCNQSYERLTWDDICQRLSMAGHKAEGDNGGIIWDREPGTLLLLGLHQERSRSASAPLIVSERHKVNNCTLTYRFPLRHCVGSC